ncbi:MAG: hypothetical protein IKP26_02840 [Clostridia bacterium]|nr:hypothetical protein [Clostridia bacterium]MBR6108680.1 hypothetical protein [Clostridia bacterium]
MKRYTDPELEIVSFEVTDITNTDDGEFGDENEVSFTDMNPNIQINW